MLTDEELSIYEVAFHLKTPIYQLVNEMPYEEFLGWMDYFNRRPIEWRDDDRTFKLLQAQGTKAKPNEIFPSLAAIYNPVKTEGDTMDISSFKASAMFNKILGAKGGDKINYDQN